MPISNPHHLTHFLKFLGQSPKEGLHAKNRQLLIFLQQQPEFNGADSCQMMRFLYQAFPPGKRTPPPSVDEEILPKEVEQLEILSESRRNLILYGPPGTGKTYTADRFAKIYLKEQLSAP